MEVVEPLYFFKECVMVFKKCDYCGHERNPKKVNKDCKQCRNRVNLAKGKLKCILVDPSKHCGMEAAKYGRACGELVPEPCEECGEEVVTGHHDSYKKKNWLKVRWLCYACHRAFHKVHTYNLETKGFEPI